MRLVRWRPWCRLGGGADASLQDADGQTPLDKAVAQVGPAQAATCTAGTLLNASCMYAIGMAIQSKAKIISAGSWQHGGPVTEAGF